MEPIAETAEAFDQYGPFLHDDQDLQERLLSSAAEVEALAPQCIGVSLSVAAHDLTFAVVASSTAAARQHTGPYVDDSVLADPLDPLDERQWQRFSATSAADGVASSLSLPILEGGRTVGEFTLYGSATETFDGRHDELAQLLGAWAGGAITNADLSFNSLDAARRAPSLLRDSTNLAMAIVLVSRSRGLNTDEAEQRLRGAAVRAGVPLSTVADAVIAVLGV